ncbi:iron-sulfur cluster biosynthesis protein [Lentilactobacillus parafarraginis]|uniref:Iron-sulfur cluster biosynthesis protein n=2 Tax=Lentilactobacillus parafarraginis TaxID=390842 RepID=A0A5R9CXN4_9LACO|nr:iron-sulfur cluster biosynthesis protein [Lentilactobacillus parafarraginis]EHL99627.1 HesB-like protein [Lentilactobacillus parafarraginis F0439]TLQ20617.1 iron-sulfur cluster biosynthesis protein [Lentilactobacillus parafarraginis]
MKINISDSASKWFQDEMGLSDGTGVRFYGKVYGKTPVHDGFSLALTRDDHPEEVYTETDKDGVKYFVDEGDEWFFKGYDLTVDFDPKKDPNNVLYSYQENGEL